MRSTSQVLRYVSTENGCTVVPDAARSCSEAKFGLVAKVLWPSKTAVHLAAAAGCSERAAAYYLSGERDPTPAAILAVINRMFD